MISGIVANILAEAKPKSSVFKLKILEGIESEFRLLTDMTERCEAEAVVAKWVADQIKAIESGAVLDAWSDVITTNREVLAKAKLLSMLSLHPELQNELAWLTIAKYTAPVFAGVCAAIDRATSNDVGEFGEYLDEKKD